MKPKTIKEIQELMFRAADSCKPIEHKLSVKLTVDEIVIIEKALLLYVAETAYSDNQLHDRFYTLRKQLDLI